MTPTCPPNYDCTFLLDRPSTGPWWEGPWGITATILGILAVTLAVTILLGCLAWWWHERRVEKFDREEREQARRHAQVIEEQRTLQMDAAQGNPELLEMVRNWARSDEARLRR